MKIASFAATLVVVGLFAVSASLAGTANPDAVLAFGSFEISTLAMSIAPMLNQRARGVSIVRADGANAAAILAELQVTFEAFKTERDAELKSIDKKLADVVQTEKVDRINNEITDLQNALDETNKLLAALRVGGGGGSEIDPAVTAHANAFNTWFRRGDRAIDADMHELEVQANLTTQSDPDGGYVVPTEMESTIDRVVGTVSALRSLARVMQISAPQYTKLVNMGGATSGWVGEEDERPNTGTPTLRQLVFNTGEIYANPYATQTLLDDARVDIAAWLADEVSIEFAEQESAAFISGDGVKKPRGILQYDMVENDTYKWGKLGFVASGAADGFAASDPADALIDLYYALKQQYRNGATWLMSDRVAGIVRKFKDGDGNYLWATPSGADMPATILQKPLATDDYMPGLGANAVPVSFGNFQRGYLIVDRAGVRLLRDPYTNKPYVSFYTTKRVGGGVQNFEAMKFLKCSA